MGPHCNPHNDFSLLQHMRVDFQFDTAAFAFKFLPFKLPYPVPFKLLGDETKVCSSLVPLPLQIFALQRRCSCANSGCAPGLQGWLDITYLSPDGTFRLSRGNKGTLFVLTREVPLPDQLLEAVAARRDDEQVILCTRTCVGRMSSHSATGASFTAPGAAAGAPAAQVMGLIEELAGSGLGEARPAESPLAEGRWRLRWSAQVTPSLPVLTPRVSHASSLGQNAASIMCVHRQIVRHAPRAQAEDANGLQKALAGKVRNFQIVEGEAGPGRLENLVELAPFLRVRAGAACRAAGRARTDVDIDDARVELFGLRCARMGVLSVPRWPPVRACCRE